MFCQTVHIALTDGIYNRDGVCLLRGTSWIELALVFKRLITSLSVLRVNQSHYKPEVPRGFQEVTVPRLHDNGAGWW